MMNKVHEIRGVPPPRAAPPGGWLPPKALSPAEEAEALLQQATDAVRLEGGAGVGDAILDDTTLAALAASRGGGGGGSGSGTRDGIASMGCDDGAPPAAPSRRELGDISQAARAALREAHREMPKEAVAALRQARHGGGAMVGEEEEEEEEDVDDEAAEAERLLQQLQEQMALEDEAEPVQASSVRTAAGGGGGAPLFPSAPTSKVIMAPVPSARSEAAREASKEEAEMSRWCHICLQDASCWCVDCDNEPYCTRCWREAHLPDEDMRTHKTVPMRGGRSAAP